MDISTSLIVIGFVWLAMIVLVARITIRSAHGSVGLPIAFLLSMTFMHIGAFTYALPGYSHQRAFGSLYLQHKDFTEHTVYAGTLATVIGVVGFMVGCWLLSPRRLAAAGQTGKFSGKYYIHLDPGFRRRLMLALGGFGLLGYVLNGVDIPIPMIQALLQVARNVSVVVICLGAALVVIVDRRYSYFNWMLLAAAIPTTYVVIWGFTSYGFISFTIFAGFWLAVLASQRFGAMRIGLGASVLTYGFLSLFVAWISYREQLRAVLWSQDASLGERFFAVGDAIGKVELLLPTNFASLDWLNIRLNQNIYVGKAIEWHEVFPALRLHGETIFLAFIALVPRFLWPGKPEMGGSAFISEHTGMQFSEGTTFSAGPVFELFVNFGLVGVFFGFLALGLMLRSIDRSASLALRQGRIFDHVRWFTVGLAFIAPLTDFFFMINTAIISFLVLTALKFVLDRGRRPNQPFPAARQRERRR